MSKRYGVWAKLSTIIAIGQLAYTVYQQVQSYRSNRSNHSR
ncbi:hypothetical protein HMPREF9103_03061 [Lentilactobacillus parafarraginis F0439]|uniref:Uncharacterized protein n=1 Tax=Lentilactobacillus parafarraginis F0439 TaxID=797515 RepID=G9ZTH6_9LACO|nr:hypothetical protein [Lentilactobacillus parafarraginis]EHL95263.1 hypothetical protein HMPREF9103_03061 [Lentilactobacillus parafarraginis F0439]